MKMRCGNTVFYVYLNFFPEIGVNYIVLRQCATTERYITTKNCIKNLPQFWDNFLE